MTFSERGELVQVTNQVSTILLFGLFISRSLVSTLLLEPTECGLIDSEPSNLAASNLKVSCVINFENNIIILKSAPC